MKNPLLRIKTKYIYEEAYCMITYRGGGKHETIWNSRDGQVPLIIYSKDGTQQLTRNKGQEIRDKKHQLKKGELYFADMTKLRAKYLAKKIVKGRWDNAKYPLYQQYGSKKEAIFTISLTLRGDGTAFTILKKGKNITKYKTKHFKMFIATKPKR